MRDVVKEIMGVSGDRKVQIFRRDDGTFGFEDLRYSAEPLERCWFPAGRYSECFAADADTAEQEARGRVGWRVER